MIDVRYHVASIIGVFLALGLGMLIGTQLGHEDTMLEEQTRLVERIEDGLNRMRTENRRLQDEVEALRERLREEERFVDAAIASRIVGRLPPSPVTVYAAEDEPLAARLQGVLETAGADVSLVRTDGPPGAPQPPYVVFWADEWDSPEDFWEIPPPGGVFAAPSRGAAWSQEAVVERSATPDGLLALAERLVAHGSAAVGDVEGVQEERNGQGQEEGGNEATVP